MDHLGTGGFPVRRRPLPVTVAISSEPGQTGRERVHTTCEAVMTNAPPTGATWNDRLSDCTDPLLMV